MFFMPEMGICIRSCSTIGASRAKKKPPKRSRTKFSKSASPPAVRSPESTASAKTRNARCRRCSANPISKRCSAYVARSIPCVSRIPARFFRLRVFAARSQANTFRTHSKPREPRSASNTMDPSASADTEHIAAFEATARAIAGDDNVRAATSDDRVAGVQPQLVVAPGNEQRLAEILKAANDANLAVIPRGGGTKLAWGNAPRRADIVLSTARLNAIVEHAHSDLTVTVEAGCTLKQLAETLARQNQRLALDGLWPSRATIGGILSTNDSGALRLRFGSMRDLVIGVTLALPDGTLAKSGGKVVKNVAGYDLPKLVIGALGTLAVITQATFRLHPTPKESRTFSCMARDAYDAQRLVLEIQDSKLAHSALQVRFVESMQPQIDVLFEATEAGCAAQAEQLKNILAPATVIDSGPAVWKARQELYSEAVCNPAEMGRSSAAPVHDLAGTAT